jgi:hypothetical protein
MKNKKTLLIAVVGLLACGCVMAQEVPSNSSNALPDFEVGNCTKYYKLDSVHISLQASKSDYLAAEEITFQGVIENTNEFPLAGGNLIAQVYRIDDGDSKVKYLLDEFVLDGIYSLVAGSKTDFDFKWRAPLGMMPGSYVVAVDLLLDKKMYMAGLPFKDDFGGGYAFFNLRNNSDIRGVYADRRKIFVNGKNIEPTSSLPYVELGKDVEIKYWLVNPGKDAQKVRIEKRLYNWDQFQGERGKVNIEEIEIQPGASQEASSKFSDLDEGIYFYSVEIYGQGGSKSIMRQRFGVGGATPSARTAFLAINDFPAKKGEATYIIGCFHSTSYEKPFDGKAYLTLRDKNNNTIQRLEYSGNIDPIVMSMRRDFNFEQDYDELKLEAQVYDKKGILIDRAELVYNCDAFKDQPDDLGISVGLGGVVKVKVLNKCNKAAKTNVAVEVMDESGKVVFYDPGYETQEYAKKVKFTYNNKYKITAQAGGIIRSIEYTHMEKDYTWAWILGAVLTAIIIAGGLAYKSKMEQKI